MTPWDSAPTGVVSLLAMLDFAARDFVQASYNFGLLLADANKQATATAQNACGDSISALLRHCHRIGLTVTHEQIAAMFDEMVKESPKSVEWYPPEIGGFRLNNVRLSRNRVETLYNTMLAEVGTVLFKAIPKDRNSYCDPKWLADTPIPEKFPTSHREFRSAGSCYAMGEATACVFHSMRALEPCLNAVAHCFGLAFEHQNWQVIIEQIEAKVRDLGKQVKTPQRIEDEKFFGNTVSHLYFVKNAWRNHVAHTRETYSDKEALGIMQHAVGFTESLCARLAES